MKIGLLLIATRRYHQFVLPLLEDVGRFFFPDEEVNVHLFTDREQPYEVDQILVPSYGFPEASLRRFEFFTDYSHRLEDDYLFYMDVDMSIVGPVGQEIIPDGLAGVHHARCWFAEGTWETNRASTAYVPASRRMTYFAGGFFGGERSAFFEMTKDLDACVAEDRARGVMAVWHDESHLNRYFADHPPLVLPPTYCFPPDPVPVLAESFPHPKVICLAKDAGCRT